MYKTLTKVYAIAFVAGGVLSVLISAVLLHEGYTPHVQPFFAPETYMFVGVIGYAMKMLCLLCAVLFASAGCKRMATSPELAVRPLFKAAVVLSIAFTVPGALNTLAHASLDGGGAAPAVATQSQRIAKLQHPNETDL